MTTAHPQPNSKNTASSANSYAQPAPSPASAMGDLSFTMMNDLPMVTQFEVHQASIIASPELALGSGSSMTHVQVALPAIEALRASHVPQSQIGTAPVSRGTTHRSDPVVAPVYDSGPELPAGMRLLERYEVRRKIGQGGMSTVYEAFDDVRREKVALKVLLPHLAASPQLQERFFQEGRLASNFSHPNIARVYDLHQTESLVLLSMELLQGSTLREDMKRRKDRGQVYRPVEVLQLLRDVCDALKMVHANNVVHRDLKPENLWLDLDGTLKIMDFGIARDVLGTKFTYDGRGSGTPYYIAPEQLASSPLLDGRADQYSLAIIAYELLTGQLPQGAVTPPHLKNPSVPQKMSKAIFRALSSDPAQRYPTIEAFYEAARFRTHMPRLMKIAIWLVAISLLGSSGYAFWAFGLPYLMPKDNSPIWAEMDQKSVTESDSLQFVVRHPNCTFAHDQLTFQLLSDAPVGAEVDPKTGRFTWTPSEDQGPKDYEFGIMSLLQKENDRKVVDTKRISISVGESVDAPVIAAPKPFELQEFQEWAGAIEARDPNLPAFGLVYSLPVDAPAGLSIHPKTGELTWKPTEKQGPDKYEVLVRVKIDHAEQVVQKEIPVILDVSEVLNPPVFSALDAREIKEHSPLSFLASARDPNVPAIDFYYALNGAPSGMTIDPQSGQVQWTPGEEHGGKEFSIVVQACRTDDNSRAEVLSEQTFMVTVSERIETPILHKLAMATAEAGKEFELKIGVTDPNNPPVEMVYELGPTAPSGMQIERSTGWIRWTPQEDEVAQELEVPVLVHAKSDAQAIAQDILRIKVAAKAQEAADSNKGASQNQNAPNFDLNGNGRLEANEQLVRDRYLKLDRNSNGQLAMNELPATTTVGMFGQLDSNGDGWLTPAEFAPMVQTAGGGTATNCPPNKSPGGNQGGNQGGNCPTKKPGGGNGGGNGGNNKCPNPKLELPLELEALIPGAPPELAPILDVIVPALTDGDDDNEDNGGQNAAPPVAPGIGNGGGIRIVPSDRIPAPPPVLRRVPAIGQQNAAADRVVVPVAPQQNRAVRPATQLVPQNRMRAVNGGQNAGNNNRNLNGTRNSQSNVPPAAEILRRIKRRAR